MKTGMIQIKGLRKMRSHFSINGEFKEKIDSKHIIRLVSIGA